MRWQVVVISLQVSVLHSIPPPPSCSQLIQPFLARGVRLSDIPSTPLSGGFRYKTGKMISHCILSSIHCNEWSCSILIKWLIIRQLWFWKWKSFCLTILIVYWLLKKVVIKQDLFVLALCLLIHNSQYKLSFLCVKTPATEDWV